MSLVRLETYEDWMTIDLDRVYVEGQAYTPERGFFKSPVSVKSLFEECTVEKSPEVLTWFFSQVGEYLNRDTEKMISAALSDQVIDEIEEC